MFSVNKFCNEITFFLPTENMLYKGLNDQEAGFLNRIASDRANYDLQMSMREREEILQYRVCGVV